MVGLADDLAGSAGTALADAAIDVALAPVESQTLRNSAELTDSGLIDSLQQEISTLRRRVGAQTRHIERTTETLTSGAALHRDLCTSDVPDLHDAAIDVFYQPVEAVGGDAYTIVRLDDRRVAIAMIDATGHGMGAAILAAYVQQSMQRSLRRAARNIEVTPSDILRSVNLEVCDARLPDCQNVAAVVGIYDERARVISVARAGTPYPILLSDSGASVKLKPGGPLLGAVEEATFSDVTLSLEPGDTLVMHTDGLEHCLADSRGRPAADVAGTPFVQSLRYRDLPGALGHIGHPRGDGTVDDDVTIITLRITPA